MVYDKFFGIDRACGRKADTSNELKGQHQTWFIREGDAGYYCNGVVRSN